MAKVRRVHQPYTLKTILQLLKNMQNISKLHSANKTYTCTYTDIHRIRIRIHCLTSLRAKVLAGIRIRDRRRAACQVPCAMCQGPRQKSIQCPRLERCHRTHASLAASISLEQEQEERKILAAPFLPKTGTMFIVVKWDLVVESFEGYCDWSGSVNDSAH